MRKLLLSACLAAACWIGDARAMHGYPNSYSPEKINSVHEIYEGKELDISSWGNKELLSQYKKFPNVEVLTADLNVFRITYCNSLGILFYGEQFKLDLNKFPKIKKLKLSSNRKECSLASRHSVTMGYNIQLTELSTLGGMENLEELDMSRLSIAKIPDSIQNFRCLKKLYLGDNFLEKLPRSIGNLTNLETLILGTDAGEWSNCLVTLPNSIGNLVNLKVLDLFGCNLRELPATIGNLRNLEGLFLGFNKLLRLPESIGNLRKLEMLSFGWPSGVSIDSIRCWERETGRSFLNEYRNQRNIKVEIPETIGNLVNLRSLRLYNCLALETLPDSIGNLVNLQSLDLSDNPALETLPDSIGNLVNLQSLYLSDNPALKTLPDPIGNLVNLEYLSVDDCVALPPTVRNLKKLGSHKLEKLEKQIVD